MVDRRDWPFDETQQWSTQDGSLYGKDLWFIYEALPLGAEAVIDACRSRGMMGVRGLSDRRIDRALQMMKAKGLIRYEKRRWTRTRSERTT